jgi:hypothetical protein
VIVCGWCHGETTPDRCSLCGRDPALPWVQRGQEPPAVNPAERNRVRMVRASTDLLAEGYEPTIERLADRLGVDPRTVRRWRAVSS